MHVTDVTAQYCTIDNLSRYDTAKYIKILQTGLLLQIHANTTNRFTVPACSTSPPHVGAAPVSSGGSISSLSKPTLLKSKEWFPQCLLYVASKKPSLKPLHLEAKVKEAARASAQHSANLRKQNDTKWLYWCWTRWGKSWNLIGRFHFAIQIYSNDVCSIYIIFFNML